MSTGLPPLSVLPALSGNGSSSTVTTPTNTPAAPTTKSACESAGGKWFTGIFGIGAECQLNGSSSYPPIFQSIVVIIVGLLLIAAGIFAFKDTRQMVTEAGKAALI